MNVVNETEYYLKWIIIFFLKDKSEWLQHCFISNYLSSYEIDSHTNISCLPLEKQCAVPDVLHMWKWVNQSLKLLNTNIRMPLQFQFNNNVLKTDYLICFLQKTVWSQNTWLPDQTPSHRNVPLGPSLSAALLPTVKEEVNIF